MVEGNREFLRVDATNWISVFGDGRHFELSNQPSVTPTCRAEQFWRSGFSRYEESFSITNIDDVKRIVLQKGSFEVKDWTNLGGLKVPVSFAAAVKKATIRGGKLEEPLSEVRYAFTANSVSKSDFSTADAAIPRMAQVVDRRPREQGSLKTGVAYATTNGTVHLDALKEKDAKIKVYAAVGDRPPVAKVTKTKRKIVAATLAFFIVFPVLLWVTKHRTI